MKKIYKIFNNSKLNSFSLSFRNSISIQNSKLLLSLNKSFASKTTKTKTGKSDLFYGIPLSKSKPKNQEELIELFKYVKNVEDVIDIYEKNKELITDIIIPLFLEFLYKAYKIQYSNLLSGKTSKLTLDQLDDLQKEHQLCQTKIIDIFSNLEEVIFTKDYSFHCQIHFYFHSFFNFKFTFNKENNYIPMIFNRLEQDPFVLATLDHLDVIKFLSIICNFEKFNIRKEEATKNIKILSSEIENMEYSKLSSEEILKFIFYLSHKNLCENIEIYTRFEPHILKYLDKYSVSDLIRLYCNYLEVCSGTDFFLDTMTFSIKKMLNKASLKDISYLLNVSKRSIWEKRYYNNSHFNDVFEDIHLLLLNKINSADKKDLSRISLRLVELGYNDKIIFQMLSTKLLAHSENINFEEFIKVVFYNFTIIDINSEVFLRKCIDLVRMNLICLKNAIKGFKDLDNLQGMMEKELINNLKIKFVNNNQNLAENIKYSNNITVFNETFNILSSLLWAMTYYSMHVDLKSVNYTEIMNDLIGIFNKFIEKADKFEKIQIDYINLHKICQFYIYVQMYSKKYNITEKFNLDFLKKITFISPPNEEAYLLNNFRQTDTFKYFISTIKRRIKQNDKLTPFSLKNKLIAQDKLYYLLAPTFINEENISNGNIKRTFIFINDINFYLHHSKIYNALIKLRKQFCKDMKIEYIDLDYYEWKELNEIKSLDKTKAEKLIEEYLKMKLTKFNV